MESTLNPFFVAATAAILSIPAAHSVRAQGTELNPAQTAGTSVAFDGDTAVVGAPGEPRNGKSNVGAAYVFTRNGGAWSQSAKLKDSEGAAESLFGTSVAVDGTTIVVGSGAGGPVHVFEKGGGAWSEETTLEAPSSSLLGGDLELDGDTAIVADAGYGGKGSAFVFVRNGGSWGSATELSLDVNVGESVALAGDTAAVGAAEESPRGAVVVFERSGGSWSRQQKLAPPDEDPFLRFGRGLALAGDTLVAGDPSADRAFLYTRSGGSWSVQKKLRSCPDNVMEDDKFGCRLSLEQGTLLVGAKISTEFGGEYSYPGDGAVDWFEKSGGTWTKRRYWFDRDVSGVPWFGHDVEVSGDTVLVGAPRGSV